MSFESLPNITHGGERQIARMKVSCLEWRGHKGMGEKKTSKDGRFLLTAKKKKRSLKS